MSLVGPLTAFLAGLALFLGPGLAFLALLAREDRETLPIDEALYLAVGTSVAASAWLGLVLAETSHFSLPLAGALAAGASLAAVLVGRGRLGWPFHGPGKLRSLAPAGLVLVLAFGLQARPSEYLVGGRDPGAYEAAMGLIARTGGLVYQDPAVLSIPREDVGLFYRHPDSPPFSWARFMGFDLESPRTGRVFPQFFHLFPAFGAYLFSAMGVRGALATPPIFGILGTLGAFFLFRRLFGPAVGLLAAVLLAVNVTEVWFARYPVSETMSQFLILLGLVAFARWEERGSTAFGILAGAALGLTLLVRIDSVLVALPIGLYVLVRRARGELAWRRAAAVLVPFGLLAAHAGLHGALFARKYVHQVLDRPYWRQPWWVFLLVAGFGVGLLAAAHRVGPRAVAWAAAHAVPLRRALGAAVVLLALYAYFLRPELSAWAGGDGNLPGTALANPGLLSELGFRRLAAHDAQAFLRLGWFVTPLALALGVLGLLHLFERWRPALLFPVVTALTFSGFYFYKIRVFDDYPFAFRRFLPVTVPFLMAFVAVLLVRWAGAQGLRKLVAAASATFLLAVYVRDTAEIAPYRDWRGAVDFVRDVARRFGPRDMVIFEQPRSIHLLSLPLWASYGVNILELARFNPDPELLRHLLQAWRHRYENIYFVHTYRTDLCGVFLQHVETLSFGSFEWYAYNRRPRPGEPEFRSLHFSISRVVPPEELQVPALPEVDIGGTDDFQVSGFYDKEGSDTRSFRWTGSCASVYVPGVVAGGSVVVTASAERRPPEVKPAEVAVSLSGRPLGRFLAGRDWADFTLPVPDPLPPGAPVLRMDVPAWRPIDLLPGSRDTRDLGIVVDRIRLLGPGKADGRMAGSRPGGGR